MRGLLGNLKGDLLGRPEAVFASIALAGLFQFGRRTLVDQSGAYALLELVPALMARGSEVHFVGLHPQPARLFRLPGLAPGEAEVASDVEAALGRLPV